MRSTRGFILSVILIGLAILPATPIHAQRTEGGTTSSANRLTRDLGEKGQIIIESLDLNNADIENVVRLLARIAGLNVITGDLSGAISVYLENVTVQDALDSILAAQGYGFIFDGNIVRVVDAAQLGEDRVETITDTFILNYLPAREVADTLRSVMQGGGQSASFSQIEANQEANAIIATDIPRRMEDIRRLIATLDQRFEQVEIEGRFVEISYTQQQEWGVDWRYFSDPANTFDVNLAPQPLDAANVAGQFKFALINGDTNLTGFLQLMETNNDIKVLASPKIMVIENEPAEIELIDEIPFVEANVSQGVITESVQFQRTGISLIVTPTIAEENEGTFVTMDLEIEQRIPGPNVVLQNSIAFPIDSRRAKSTLVVPDETTLVIGGLKSSDTQYSYQKVPFLGSVPFFGSAFRRRAKQDDQTELMIFVTPRVIYETPPLTYNEREIHDEVDEDVDALRTQSQWREDVEAPVDMLDKGILYSGRNTNAEKYERVHGLKDQLEGVQPYRLLKDKGQRPIRITGDEEGIQREEMEFVDEDLEESGEKKVLDFSAVEEHAGTAEGNSESGWRGRDATSESTAPPSAPPIIINPPPPPPVQQPAPQSNTPSWLHDGARDGSGRNQSDAGDPNQEEAIQEASADLEPVEEPPTSTRKATLELAEIQTETPVEEVVQVSEFAAETEFEEFPAIPVKNVGPFEPYEPDPKAVERAQIADVSVAPEVEAWPAAEEMETAVEANALERDLVEKAFAPLEVDMAAAADPWGLEDESLVSTRTLSVPAVAPPVEIVPEVQTAFVEPPVAMTETAKTETAADPWGESMREPVAQVEAQVVEPITEPAIEPTTEPEFETFPPVEVASIAEPAAEIVGAALLPAVEEEVAPPTAKDPREVSRVSLKESDQPQVPVEVAEIQPENSKPSVPVVDLRTPIEDPERAGIRKYLSADIVAALQELDSVEDAPEPTSPVSQSLGMNESRANPEAISSAFEPVPRLEAPVPPAGQFLAQQSFTSTPNPAPAAQPQKAKPWWKRVWRSK